MNEDKINEHAQAIAEKLFAVKNGEKSHCSFKTYNLFYDRYDTVRIYQKDFSNNTVQEKIKLLEKNKIDELRHNSFGPYSSFSYTAQMSGYEQTDDFFEESEAFLDRLEKEHESKLELLKKEISTFNEKLAENFQVLEIQKENESIEKNIHTNQQMISEQTRGLK